MYDITAEWGGPKNKKYKPALSFSGMWLYIPKDSIK